MQPAGHEHQDFQSDSYSNGKAILFTARNIKSVNLNFQPDEAFKTDLQKATFAAINAYRPQAELFGRIKQARYDFIDRICEKRPTNNKFRNGWRNRIKDFKFD